jgi:hypothetical protein
VPKELHTRIDAHNLVINTSDQFGSNSSREARRRVATLPWHFCREHKQAIYPSFKSENQSGIKNGVHASEYQLLESTHPTNANLNRNMYFTAAIFSLALAMPAIVFPSNLTVRDDLTCVHCGTTSDGKPFFAGGELHN